MSVLPLRRMKATMMATPTAASAALTAMTKKAKRAPSTWPRYRIEHQFDGEEHDDGALAREGADDAHAEEEGRQDEVVRKADHRHSLLERMTAPTMAPTRRSEAISKGTAYRLTSRSPKPVMEPKEGSTGGKAPSPERLRTRKTWRMKSRAVPRIFSGAKARRLG